MFDRYTKCLLTNAAIALMPRCARGMELKHVEESHVRSMYRMPLSSSYQGVRVAYNLSVRRKPTIGYDAPGAFRPVYRMPSN